MRLVAAVLGIGLLVTCEAQAFTADEAKEILAGTWTGANETWIFEAESWKQYVGGAVYDTTFQIEPMPALMARIVSASSGKKYVLHFDMLPPVTVTAFEEGKTQAMGYLKKVASTDSSAPQPSAPATATSGKP